MKRLKEQHWSQSIFSENQDMQILENQDMQIPWLLGHFPIQCSLTTGSAFSPGESHASQRLMDSHTYSSSGVRKEGNSGYIKGVEGNSMLFLHYLMPCCVSGNREHPKLWQETKGKLPMFMAIPEITDTFSQILMQVKCAGIGLGNEHLRMRDLQLVSAFIRAAICSATFLRSNLSLG